MIELERIRPEVLRGSFPMVCGDCRYTDVGTGWRGIVWQMCLDLERLPAGSVKITELGEKMGGLRVSMHTDGLSPEQEAAVRLAKVLAEERSRYLCEVCGEIGSIRRPPDGSAEWLRCRCHRHMPRDQTAWPIIRRERRHRIGGQYWVYDHLLDRMRVDELTAEKIYQTYRGILSVGAVDHVPVGWLAILDEYLRAAATSMEGADFRIQRIVEAHGGLDLESTSRPMSMTDPRFDSLERLGILLEARSLTTCRECGRRGHGYAIDGDIQTLCDDHAVGTLIRERDLGFVRATLDGFVRYDIETDSLVDVEHPAGDA
ncbi:hypothetical protein BJF92_00700 [Rhizobium rhizosphaerae]|uniref:Uncharacterized protein n=1 Tax=Xaviernesmea rhizosphaerae TaxID=1672749 RepID=A0A1Q9AED2_9HYPH|nr:hypothetical protein [Xaviernesmea rhizosphaerae]OLP53320.1 hypothetical protein BJF92_00700 [Xaviernesmea rhizosphaerae]